MAANEVTKEDISRIMRHVSHQRPIVKGKCVVCGAEFQGTTKRRYCSNKCSMRASRERGKKRDNQEGATK